MCPCMYVCVCVMCLTSDIDLLVCMCACVQALDVFGLKPSEAQQQVLRSRLKADPAGTVAFAGENQRLRIQGRPGF